MKYDFLIVGSGLFGAVMAQRLSDNGAKVLVIEKRSHLGGNVYTEEKHGIHVHKYGPHIFHTSNENVWEYVNRFANFNNYEHRVLANYKGELFPLPFTLKTFNHLWGCETEQEARQIIAKQTVNIKEPNNVEEWVLAKLGTDIYEKLVYGYTKKQWMREPRDICSSVIKRLPIRFDFDDRYLEDKYQGIPENGYTSLVENLLDGVQVNLEEDFFEIANWKSIASALIYTGSLDTFFKYKYGELEYLSLKFEEELLKGQYQTVAQVNFTDENTPHTRVIEHKHFNNLDNDLTVITREFPSKWSRNKPSYYPINDNKNNLLYQKYKQEIDKEDDIYIGGRLATYRYLDMDQVISQALHLSKLLIN